MISGRSENRAVERIRDVNRIEHHSAQSNRLLVGGHRRTGSSSGRVARDCDLSSTRF